MQGQDFTVHRTYVKYMYLQEIEANSARTCQSRARIGDYGKIIVVLYVRCMINLKSLIILVRKGKIKI